MHLFYRNVNDAFRDLVSGIHEGRVTTDVRPSRYGEVVEVAGPVTITYSNPLERVLFNTARDCNPFSLLYESLYMLAGRNDVAPLAYYTKRFAEFSDDGRTLNDAYGYRWRNHYTTDQAINDCCDDVPPRPGVDQLELLVDHLRANPWSRRAVLQMWNVEDDLLLVNDSKAVCCNLSVLFQVGPGACRACNGTGGVAGTHTNRWHPCATCDGKPHDVPRYLNMTVFNRSNDLVWGLLGANYVTFTVLQEYVAARLGLDVGVYHHVTANLHAYTANWKPEAWLACEGTEAARQYHPDLTLVPLVQSPARFEEELPEFVGRHSRDSFAGEYREPFLRDVAQPLCIAYHHHRRREYGRAAQVVEQCKADDWRISATAWLERRAKKHAGT